MNAIAKNFRCRPWMSATSTISHSVKMLFSAQQQLIVTYPLGQL